MYVSLAHHTHLWLAAQLRRPGRIKRCRELDDDGLGANKRPHGFDMEALRILWFEPPPPDRRTDPHGKVPCESVKVQSMFATHINSMLITILSVSVLAASPLASADCEFTTCTLVGP